MTTETTPTKTRETWLTEAIEAFRAPLAEHFGIRIPEKIRVSVGFPQGASSAGRTIGECYPSVAQGDKASVVFISPEVSDPVRALDILLHELLHAADDCKSGHRGDFAKWYRALEFGGKPTATVAEPGSWLHDALSALADELGEYDHQPLPKGFGRRKQGTRMLKVSCGDCGYIARTSSKWLDAYGAPICPCNGEQMNEG